MTKINDLKERITLLKRVIFEEESGDLNQVWKTGDKVWAQIVPITSKKVLENDGWSGEGLQPDRYHVTMRYRAGNFDGFLWRNQTLSRVSSPQIDVSQRWMTFAASISKIQKEENKDA